MTSRHKKNSRRLLWIKIGLPLLGLLGLVWMFNSDWSGDAEIQAQFDTNDADFAEPTITIQNPSSKMINEDGERIEMTAADIISQDEDATRFAGQDVDANLELEGGNWQIRADQGQSFEDGDRLNFDGNVDAVLDGETKIKSDALNVRPKQDRIWSQTEINLENDRFSITANQGSLEGKKGKRVFQFEGQVQGNFKMRRSQ